MERQTAGTVTAAKKQWWLKVNTKSLRNGPLDGAAFPSIIKVCYTVDGKDFTKWKWIPAGERVPEAGSRVTVRYRSDKPKKAKITL